MAKEKLNFSTPDFSDLSWHDCTVHGIGMNHADFQLLFDIDYITDWIEPVPGQSGYTFRVAPATLVFRNVYALAFDIESNGGIQIDEVRRSEEGKPINSQFIENGVEWLWEFDCHEGRIAFRSVGFDLQLRHEPILVPKQSLLLGERGGIVLKLYKEEG